MALNSCNRGNNPSNTKPSSYMKIKYTNALDLVYKIIVVLLLSLNALLLASILSQSTKDQELNASRLQSINDSLNNITIQVEYED